jgi:hypothetical protein
MLVSFAKMSFFSGRIATYGGAQLFLRRGRIVLPDAYPSPITYTLIAISKDSAGASARKRNTRQKQFEGLLRELGRLCGFDKSESGTEAFVDRLFTCAFHVLREIQKSHTQGLCLDASQTLAVRLEEAAEKKVRKKTKTIAKEPEQKAPGPKPSWKGRKSKRGETTYRIG